MVNEYVRKSSTVYLRSECRSRCEDPIKICVECQQKLTLETVCSSAFIYLFCILNFRDLLRSTVCVTQSRAQNRNTGGLNLVFRVSYYSCHKKNAENLTVVQC